MIKDRKQKNAPRARARGATALQAPGWNAAWLLFVGGAGAALASVFPAEGLRIGVAGGCVAIPALPGLLIKRDNNEHVRALLMVLWAAGSGAACILGGGLSGPLAIWCVAPIAAAAALGGGRRLAEAAALSFLVAMVAGMAQLLGVALPPPSAEASLWLTLLALSSTVLGLGAGLILSERRGAAVESQQAAELARTRAVLNDLPYLAVLMSDDGKVEALYGRTLEGLELAVGRSLASGVRLSDATGVAEAVRLAGAQGEADTSFAPVLAGDRCISGRFVRRDDGGLIALLRDATEERDQITVLEQAKNDAEQLAAGKARFLANMSHELRTPLNAIMGFSDIMRARMFGPLPDKYAEYGNLIHESGAHLLDLINDVLDMSKIEAERYQLSREIFDGREAVNAAMRLMRVQADGAGVQLRGVLPSNPLPLDADRRALKQIVLNLVSNALKFTPKGGSVTVTAHGFDGVFELVVADNGVGIAKADLERIGRPYEQGEAGRQSFGTGLGLSLVRAFAQLHGGEMSIESTLGEGATVTVRLPVLKSIPEPLQPLPETLGENVVAFAPPR